MSWSSPPMPKLTPDSKLCPSMATCVSSRRSSPAPGRGLPPLSGRKSGMFIPPSSPTTSSQSMPVSFSNSCFDSSESRTSTYIHPARSLETNSGLLHLSSPIVMAARPIGAVWTTAASSMTYATASASQLGNPSFSSIISRTHSPMILRILISILRSLSSCADSSTAFGP